MKQSSLIMLIVLSISALASFSAIQSITASGTTYHIEANGSIFPSISMIVRNGDVYTLAGNISGAIVIEKDNIMIDGAGYALEGPSEIGMNLTSRTNVTIKNTVIKTFDYGIFLTSSNNNSIVECDLAGCIEGIWLEESSHYNIISGNSVTGNSFDGIYLSYSSNNRILGNEITLNTGDGVQIQSSSNNTVSTNTITNNGWGVESYYSSNNSVFHNNLINNTDQAYSSSSLDFWDDGYPRGGNYWSNYTGVDKKCGPSQDHHGSDGIGDTPYVIDTSNRDDYPLMNPWTPPSGHNVAVISVVPSKAVIEQGYSGDITVYGANKGAYSETFNVTVYANMSTIATTTVPIESGSTTTITISWTPANPSFSNGNYTISAYAWPVPGETNTSDNNFTGGHISVAATGDLTGGSANPWDFVPDGVCDGSDLSIVAKCFGSWPAAKPPLTWNINCDVNNDGVVDGSDLAIVAKHFGEG